jgi:hypothetical protein
MTQRESRAKTNCHPGSGLCWSIVVAGVVLAGLAGVALEAEGKFQLFGKSRPLTPLGNGGAAIDTI